MNEFVDNDIQFVDRDTEFPNRKILEVKRVERDETGELLTMCVEETRDEGKITEEGTPLNSTTLNNIISEIEGTKTYITDEIGKAKSYTTEEIGKAKSYTTEEIEKAKMYITEEFIPGEIENTKTYTMEEIEKAKMYITEEFIPGEIENVKTYITEEIGKAEKYIIEKLVPKMIEDTKVDIINSLVPKMIVEERESLINALCTAEQKVKLDKARINIPTTAFFDFYLPTKEFFGSNIEWEIQSGTAITIQNGLAIVNTTNTNQKVDLIATITNGNATDNRVFEINIPSIEDASGYEEMNEEFLVVADASSASIDRKTIQLDENSGFVVENENEDILTIETNISQNNELTIVVTCFSLPVDCGIRTYNFIVRVGDKTTGQYTKWIYCTVDVIESISPED